MGNNLSDQLQYIRVNKVYDKCASATMRIFDTL